MPSHRKKTRAMSRKTTTTRPLDEKLALSTRELAEELGLGRRSARRLAKMLGRRVGNKYLTSVAALSRWLDGNAERRG